MYTINNNNNNNDTVSKYRNTVTSDLEEIELKPEQQMNITSSGNTDDVYTKAGEYSC